MSARLGTALAGDSNTRLYSAILPVSKQLQQIHDQLTKQVLAQNFSLGADNGPDIGVSLNSISVMLAVGTHQNMLDADDSMQASKCAKSYFGGLYSPVIHQCRKKPVSPVQGQVISPLFVF